jgi:Protein of unknown function (DUF1275)
MDIYQHADMAGLIQNAVARKLAVPDMTTTVLTMTLTGLGADLRAVFQDRGSAAGRASYRRHPRCRSRRSFGPGTTAPGKPTRIL